MTNKNSQSMATEVETYFVEETTNLIHDGEALTKWNDRVETLGLEGQKSVVVADKSPIPFLWMNDAIISTFEMLCPTKVDIKKYDKSPIPVELLDIVALSVKEEHFNLIEVWFNEKQKDPVIVGYSFRDEDHGSDWSTKYYAKKYLIGRWADVKASLDTLIERAKKLFIHSQTVDIKQIIRTKQRELEDIEAVADQKFGGLPPTQLQDLF